MKNLYCCQNCKLGLMVKQNYFFIKDKKSFILFHLFIFSICIGIQCFVFLAFHRVPQSVTQRLHGVLSLLDSPAWAGQV